MQITMVLTSAHLCICSLNKKSHSHMNMGDGERGRSKGCQIMCVCVLVGGGDFLKIQTKQNCPTVFFCLFGSSSFSFLFYARAEIQYYRITCHRYKKIKLTFQSTSAQTMIVQWHLPGPRPDPDCPRLPQTDVMNTIKLLVKYMSWIPLG